MFVNYKRNETFIKQFGEHVRKLRVEKEISQEELADRADLTLSQVGRIERGLINTSLTMIYLLAKALEMKPYELLMFDFTAEKHSPP